MFDVFIMDMGGDDRNVSRLQQRFPHSQVVRYYDSHLNTLKRCVARARTPFCWVISSCCEYEEFDFDYRALPWEAYQIHCWASGKQQQGDTFLIPVAEFNKQIDIERLEWYKDINWHSDGVYRTLWTMITTPTENITQALKEHEFTQPYVWVNGTGEIDPSLWRDRAFHVLNKSGSVSLAPRDIKSHLMTQIYDYPFIMKHNEQYLNNYPLDIVYISNGEPDAERWYEHLLSVVAATGSTNWVRRVKDVTGRSSAYKAAAKASTTPWFFAVFAKLEVVPDFDWAWQPDYLQEPKHYIFNSRNPVNGLEYGHMGIIAYNQQLVLDTDEHGLDFTLSKPHAVVPVLSAVAHYNTTDELTWRTAFREVLKLKDDIERTGSVESAYRLDIWLTQAEGYCAGWSLKGARDAVDYYDLVDGDYDKLLLSFEWAWLKDYWNNKVSTTNSTSSSVISG